MKKSPAFSLIEVLVAIGIIAIVAIPSFFAFFRSQANQQLAASAEILSSHLRQTRTFSRDSRGGKTWGIRVTLPDLNKYDLVSYTDDIAVQTTEENYRLKDGIKFVTSFTVWFDKLSGDIDMAMFPIELENKYGRKHTVTVSQNGVIEITPN